ncbi:MAG: thiolase domain-containing protein [Nitrososphaerota archaeon]|nr:thiolase domain-containing protein [Nitrososphaerota archaeon]MDG6939791.1 thiolase domain-containing protein [Nitrososphaerota archaeon]
MAGREPSTKSNGVRRKPARGFRGRPSLLRRVFIASVGLVNVGKHPEMGIADLMVEASVGALSALPDAAPDRVVVGNMFSGVGCGQEHLGALLSSSLGYQGIPAYKVEAACGSGGAAAHNAYLSVKAGESDCVLVTGVEKMTDLDTAKVTSALAMADSQEYTASVGATFISLNAVTHRLYLSRHGVPKEDMAAFPVMAHRNALSSKHAMFHKAVTAEDVLSSPVMSDPIRLLDSSPVCDGAASLVLVSEEMARKVSSPLVEILASEVAANIFSIYERPDPLEYAATKAAFRRAVDRSGVRPEKLDFLEPHDAFSITSALSLESMGLSPAGRAPAEAAKGRFALDGDLPIGTFGGLKARGHPVGASGTYQLAEAYMQLAGRAGPNQVSGAKVGMTQNMGGVDTTTAVHILASAN